MGVDLTLLPFDADGNSLSFSHTVLSVERRRDLWTVITDLESDIVPEGFWSYLSREGDQETHYGLLSARPMVNRCAIPQRVIWSGWTIQASPTTGAIVQSGHTSGNCPLIPKSRYSGTKGAYPMKAKVVSSLNFNIGDKVEYSLVNRKGVVVESGEGKITGLAHARFGIYNVVVGYRSISVQQQFMGKVQR